MITFSIIRGHKLVLWANRLGLDKQFVKFLDKFGVHYVSNIEKIDEDLYTLVVLAKLAEQEIPFPIIFSCNEALLNSLVEVVTTEPQEIMKDD